MEERLQKILSAAGLCSRRQAETYIQAGRVTVNGAVAGLGDRADTQRDEIALDGKVIAKAEEQIYILLHKPRGYVTTLADEKGRPTVAQLVADCGARVYPIGRLDMDSEGLLLLTNDGDFANRVAHPSHEMEKEYHVRVSGAVDGCVERLRALRRLEDGSPIRGAQVRLLSREEGSCLLAVTIHQGLNRQVRRMCAAVGLTVHRLRRVREGALELGSLPAGKWRALTDREVEKLRN